VDSVFSFFVLNLLFFFGSSALAQNASMSGLVTDPSGAAISNVQITLTSTTKGTSQQTKTNNNRCSVPECVAVL